MSSSHYASFYGDKLLPQWTHGVHDREIRQTLGQRQELQPAAAAQASSPSAAEKEQDQRRQRYTEVEQTVMLSWVDVFHLWEMPKGLFLVRSFGNVCIYCLHFSRVWFKCCFSGTVQPSKLWVSISGHREIRGRGGKVWEKFLGSVSFCLLLAADQGAIDR